MIVQRAKRRWLDVGCAAGRENGRHAPLVRGCGGGAGGRGRPEVLAVRAGVRVASALLDLAAGWSLLAPAVAAPRLAPGCRATAALAGVLWFGGTLQMVEGSVGRAGELWGWLTRRRLAGGVAGRAGVLAGAARRALARAVVVVARFDSGAGGLERRSILATGVALGAVGVRRPPSPGGLVLHRAAGAFGAVLALAAVSRLLGASGGWVEQLVAIVVAGCGAALVAVGASARDGDGVVTALRGGPGSPPGRRDARGSAGGSAGRSAPAPALSAGAGWRLA